MIWEKLNEHSPLKEGPLSSLKFEISAPGADSRIYGKTKENNPYLPNISYCHTLMLFTLKFLRHCIVTENSFQSVPSLASHIEIL